MATPNLKNESFENDPAKIAAYNQKFAQGVDEHVEHVKEAADKVEVSVSFLEVLRLIGHSISALAHMLPPIRVALEAISSGWDIFKDIYIEKGSKLSLAAKIGYSVAILGIALGIILAPVGAVAILYAASAGLALVKDSIKAVRSFKEYRHASHELKVVKGELETAKKELAAAKENSFTQRNCQAKVNKLSGQVAKLETAKAQAKEELKEKTTNVVLGATVAAGLVLMIFPPTMVIGVSLLLGSAVAGVAIKVAPKITQWIKAKQQVNASAKAGRMPTADSNDPKVKPGLFNWLKNKVTNLIQSSPKSQKQASPISPPTHAVNNYF